MRLVGHAVREEADRAPPIGPSALFPLAEEVGHRGMGLFEAGQDFLPRSALPVELGQFDRDLRHLLLDPQAANADDVDEVRSDRLAFPGLEFEVFIRAEAEQFAIQGIVHPPSFDQIVDGHALILAGFGGRPPVRDRARFRYNSSTHRT